MKPIIDDLFKAFGVGEEFLFFAYDWGCALFLNYCLEIKKQKAVNPLKNKILNAKMVLFHPSWTLDMKLLNGIPNKVFLIWVKEEQLHAISYGEKMNKLIPNCKLLKLKCGKFRPEMAYGYYDCLAKQINNYIEEILKEPTKTVT